MFLARVIGQVVATKKDEKMKGHKLLILQPMLVDKDDPSKLKPGGSTIVAADSVGVGRGEMVLFCQGSSARQATNMKPLPIDAAVVGIVDNVDVLGKNVYKAQDDV